MSDQKNPVNTTDNKKTNLAQILLRIIQGAIIGAGCILPGVSGGVLCIMFGVYQPMMALLAHPTSAFKKYYKLLLPVLIGFIVGLVGWAIAIKMLLQVNENITKCIFVGLVFGMLPSLYRDAGRQKRTWASWVAFAVSLVIIFFLLSLFQKDGFINLTTNIYWFFLGGIIWGLSLVIPGLSSSSILMSMNLSHPANGITDLYGSIMAGIGSVDFTVILPLLLGVLITALLSARLVNRLLERHHSVMYHIILGAVIASTLLIIPLKYKSTAELLIAVICGIIGCIAAIFLDIWGSKLKAKHRIEE